MVNISIRYTGDLPCAAIHGPSQRELATDAPVDNNGKGEAFSPTDLVATALGTCMATVMAIAAQRHGIRERDWGCFAEVAAFDSDRVLRRLASLDVLPWLLAI